MTAILDFLRKIVCLVGVSILIPLLASYTAVLVIGDLRAPLPHAAREAISRKSNALRREHTRMRRKGDQERLEQIEQELKELEDEDKKNKLREDAKTAFYVFVLVGLLSLVVGALIGLDYVAAGLVIGGMLCLVWGYVQSSVTTIPSIFRMLPMVIVLLVILLGIYRTSQHKESSELHTS